MIMAAGVFCDQGSWKKIFVTFEKSTEPVALVPEQGFGSFTAVSDPDAGVDCDLAT
jgi:hypothetical protein